jgi:transposase-like protein
MIELSSAHQSDKQQFLVSLDAIAREGATRMLTHALRLEVQEYIDRHRDQRDDEGRALVVRNGSHKPRDVMMGAGMVEIKVPRVNDRRDGEKFTSKILPPYLRKSPNMESLLPILYLKGLSTTDFQSALSSILGEGAGGLSPSSISALKRSWEKDYDEWKDRQIVQDYVYIWADGVNVSVRLGEDKKLCLLVVIGANRAGQKHLLAVEAGYRESQDSWLSVLRSLKERGLKNPLLAIGDGALGFWSALRTVYPSTDEQRCWVHKIANVLDKLPKRLQPKAKELLHEMMMAETAADANAAREQFEVAYGAKYEKAVECITKDWQKLVTFFRYPGTHWQHIRTTNPIESTFATVKLRTNVTKGAGSPKAAITMAFKLMQEAEKRWRRLRGYEEIPLLISGVEYRDGVVVTPDSHREAVN